MAFVCKRSTWYTDCRLSRLVWRWKPKAGIVDAVLALAAKYVALFAVEMDAPGPVT